LVSWEILEQKKIGSLFAAITGSVAEAFWGVPEDIRHKSSERLDKQLLSVIERWEIFLSEAHSR